MSMKRLILVCICMVSFVVASYAYVANVDIANVNGSLYQVNGKEDPTKTFTAFKEQFPSELFLVNDFTISDVAFWTNGSWLRLAGSNVNSSGTMTLKVADGTVFSFYSFGARNSCNKEGWTNDGDGLNHAYCVEITSPDNQTLHRAGGNGMKTFSNSSYASQLLTISAKNSSSGPNRVELSDFKFRVKVPELVKANQGASIDLVKIDRADAGKGIMRDAKLSFVVADPIVSNSTDKNEIAKYYSIQLSNTTGNKWEIFSTSIGNVDKSGNATLEVVVRYTDATSENLGNFSSELVVRPVNNVTYDVVAPLEIKTKLNISVGATISNTLEWNIPVTNYIDDAYTIGSGDGKCYKNANSTAVLGAPTILSQQPSAGYASVVEIINNQLKMVGEGTATLRYIQPAEGDYSASSLVDLAIKVVKHTPIFSINNGDLGNILYVNREYKNLISSDNNEIEFSLSIDDADAPFVEVLPQGSVKTGSNVKNSVIVHVSQPASKHYYAKDEDFSFTIEYNPQHVGTLCNNITEELFNNPDFYVNKTASHKSAVWGGAKGIQFGGTGGGSGSSYDDEVVLRFMGTPDVITWETTGNGKFTFAWSADNTLNSYTTISGSGATLSANAQYIKISYVGNGNDGLSYVSKLCITEKVGIDVDPKTLSLTAINGQVPNGVINVRPSNLETITLTINSTDFVLQCGTHSYTSQSGLTLDYTDGLGIDCSPVVPVEIQYVGDYASAVGKTAQVDITDGNGHTATVSVKIQSIAQNEYGVPSSIYASMATTTGIETGTEHKTNNNHPYHLKKAVDLTGTFAGGAACFDKLYIFGVTKGYTSAGEETTGVNQTYSKTPCYVYTKNGDHYDFEQYVENMNSDTKGIGVDVAANGQKLYFTGWCPYASAGYLPSDIGAFHIKGGAGAKVDVYLDNCFLFVRDKTVNHKVDADETQAETKFGNYPMGSGGAFVFETTSTNSGSPFSPMVHLRGENILRSTHGNRVYVSFVGQVKTATQISSPIHMYTTSTSQYETLTIDDKWPTNAVGTETENVNGSLQLTKKTSNSPSIDLGNGNSVVNFNGGQVHLQNALPMSVAYSSTMAISWRSYSQYGLTIYGIGTDQASGEVNFNDGTISATPIDQTAWSASTAEAYKGYYWDNESMKCPKNTHINGGSYNCNVWACSSFDDKGSSVTDCKGTSLCKKRIKITGVEENGMAIFDFPYSESGDDGQTLESYYKNNGFLYGHNSITADEKDSVNLMLPCSYIGSEAVVSKLVIPWAMCVPALAAGAGNNTSKTFGGDITVLNDETHEISNFVWTRIDGNMEDIIEGGNYTSPEYGATIKFQGNPHDYSQVENAEYYTIQNDLHIIMPAAADNWMTFTAPFDVKKIYVLESYPDSILQEKTREEALKLQATANVDFAYFLAFNVLGVEPMSTSPLSGLYNSWLSYEYGQDTLSTGFLKKDDKGRWLSRGNYEKKYRGKRELVAYDGTNGAKANFYAYIAEGYTWQLKGNAVEPNWKCIDIGEDGVLFKKGQTYSLLFPYCVGCWTEAEKIDGRNYWDYWSGKLLIFEGDGPQTVYGKSHQSDLLSATAATNTVSISGNSTFADMTSSSKDIWTFGNEIGDESFAANTDGYENIIEPATAFLINGIQSKAGAAPKRINLRSGAVTYENGTDAETGVPTIAGGHSLIVNSVAGGVEVVPVEAQQVSVYGSAGQLIVSDYLTDETTLSLPAGIYIIRGEKEMVKVVVR